MGPLAILLGAVGVTGAALAVSAMSSSGGGSAGGSIPTPPSPSSSTSASSLALSPADMTGPGAAGRVDLVAYAQKVAADIEQRRKDAISEMTDDYKALAKEIPIFYLAAPYVGVTLAIVAGVSYVFDRLRDNPDAEEWANSAKELIDQYAQRGLVPGHFNQDGEFLEEYAKTLGEWGLARLDSFDPWARQAIAQLGALALANGSDPWVVAVASKLALTDAGLIGNIDSPGGAMGPTPGDKWIRRPDGSFGWSSGKSNTLPDFEWPAFFAGTVASVAAKKPLRLGQDAAILAHRSFMSRKGITDPRWEYYAVASLGDAWLAAKHAVGLA